MDKFTGNFISITTAIPEHFEGQSEQKATTPTPPKVPQLHLHLRNKREQYVLHSRETALRLPTQIHTTNNVCTDQPTVLQSPCCQQRHLTMVTTGH